MHTLRRKSQIYPVAFAISLLFACHARAQLCLTAAERSETARLTEQINLGTPPAKTSNLVNQDRLPAASQIAPSLTVSTVTPRSAPPALVLAEDSSGKSLSPTTLTQNTPAPSNRPQGDFVRSLVLASPQAASAEMGLQTRFAE